MYLLVKKNFSKIGENRLLNVIFSKLEPFLGYIISWQWWQFFGRNPCCSDWWGRKCVGLYSCRQNNHFRPFSKPRGVLFCELNLLVWEQYENRLFKNIGYPFTLNFLFDFLLNINKTKIRRRNNHLKSIKKNSFVNTIH